MYSPVSIPDMFRELVANAATALGYTLNFKFGTWRVINDELAKEQNSKFPLVALLQGWEETREDETTMKVDGLRILIAVRSGENDLAQVRNDSSYLAQVIPIYNALCDQIADTYFFTGYNQNFKHTTKDWPNLGLENSERLLEDCTDGRLLENISLRVNLQTCAYPQGPCYYTPCANGLEIETLSIIEDVSLSGLTQTSLSLTFTAATFISADATPQEDANIDWGNGVDGDMAIAIGETKQISVLALPNGFYTGQISFNGAYVDFYYRIAAGRVTEVTTQIQQSLTYDLSCPSYPNYPITVTCDYTTSDVARLSKYTLFIMGVSEVEDTIVPEVLVVSRSTEATRNLHMYTALQSVITQNLSWTGVNPLSLQSILSTRCINTD